MKKLKLVLVMLCLCVGCTLQTSPLSEDAYHKALLAKYENTAPLLTYEGSAFEAKLIVMDRYIRDDQTMYYNYQIYIKPLSNLDTKKLNVRMKLSKAQAAYYSGTENQTVFGAITYPVALNKDENVPCYEYRFSVSAASFQSVSQADWEAMMQKITIELGFGSKQEKITFDLDKDLNTYSGNGAAFTRSFGEIQ